ncbi:MAG: LTA synthase family protein [Muribaculaceae bacterium]|nr:LTA synthase family protein [Muribaculaceae bacterium]
MGRLKKIFPADVWQSRLGLFFAALFAKLVIFDLIWCGQTTFRAMSDVGLYVNTLLVALLLVVPYMATKKSWVEIVVMAATDVLLVANLMYCRTYYAAIPADSYSLVGNLADFKASVADSFRWVDLLLPLTTILTAFLLRRVKNRPCAGAWRHYLVVLAVLFALSFVVALFRGGFRSHYERMRESCYYTTCTTPVYSVFGNILYDVTSTPDPAATAAEREEITAWLNEKSALRPHQPLPDSIARRQNMVMVFCESLESWVIGAKIDGKEITPRLNALVADSTTFYAPNVLTQVAAGRSIDAQLLIEAGLLPLKSGVFSSRYHANMFFTIPKAMREAFGVRSYLLTCDKPEVWNQILVARSFGIDTLLTRSSWRNDELVGNPAKLSDGSFIAQSIEKMRGGEIWPEGEPAYVQFVTYSGHNPFVLPDRLKRIDISEAYPERMRDYMTMANYTDWAIGQLIDYLRSRSDFGETIIVIVGDHEGLASDRRELLKSPLAKGVVDEGQHTPFIVVNSPVGGRYEPTMGQIDIYPTLLNLLRLDGYRWSGLGQSVFDPSKPPYAISSTSNMIEGDTTGVSVAVKRNIARMRDISDKILRHNAFAELP